jgi:hypothetical protein
MLPVIHRPVRPTDDPYQIPRFTVNGGGGLGTVADLLSDLDAAPGADTVTVMPAAFPLPTGA